MPHAFTFTTTERQEIVRLADQAEAARIAGSPIGAYSPMYAYIISVIEAALSSGRVLTSERAGVLESEPPPISWTRLKA